MTITAPLERPVRRLGRLGLALGVGSMLVWSGVANAAPAPESFSGLAKEVTPAVVNIASARNVETSGVRMPDLPFEIPEGSPFEEFFKQFRERNERGGGRPRAMTGLGSGFIVDPDGYVVTNHHVVNEADEVTVRLDDDSVFPAEIIGSDPKTDLALLKIKADRKLPAVEFGDSDTAEVGDWVMAVGNPFGLGGSVTAGIVSARGRNINAGPYDDFIQVDAAINRGNSGGPLFNMDGEVIGVNTAIYSPNGGSVGIGFSIPSNIAKSVVAQLREHGRVERGWLGVRIQNVTPEIASALGLDNAEGAMVVDVNPDSPAAKAGLQQGDVVLSFDGKEVEDSRGLARIVGNTKAGIAAPMQVWRDGDEKRLSVTTGEMPGSQQVASADRGGDGRGTYKSDELNAELAALTPALRQQFGVAEEVDGVLVVDVKTGSAFEQGLRPGDVIKRVAQTKVTAPSEVESQVEKAKDSGKKSVLLLVNRQGNDLFLGLKLGVA